MIKYRFRPQSLLDYSLGHQTGSGYAHGTAAAAGFNEGDVIVKVVAKVVRGRLGKVEEDEYRILQIPE